MTIQVYKLFLYSLLLVSMSVVHGAQQAPVVTPSLAQKFLACISCSSCKSKNKVIKIAAKFDPEQLLHKPLWKIVLQYVLYAPDRVHTLETVGQNSSGQLVHYPIQELEVQDLMNKHSAEILAGNMADIDITECILYAHSFAKDADDKPVSFGWRVSKFNDPIRLAIENNPEVDPVVVDLRSFVPPTHSAELADGTQYEFSIPNYAYDGKLIKFTVTYPETRKKHQGIRAFQRILDISDDALEGTVEHEKELKQSAAAAEEPTHVLAVGHHPKAEHKATSASSVIIGLDLD